MNTRSGLSKHYNVRDPPNDVQCTTFLIYGFGLVNVVWSAIIGTSLSNIIAHNNAHLFGGRGILMKCHHGGMFN